MSVSNYGQVYLVGAGPGNPNFLTKKAQRLIENADIILYDRLVNPLILQYAKPEIEIVDVGKKPYTKHVQQDNINQLMVKAASEHNHVVRLKGGDPAIFGRLHEEVETLRDLDINFEIVPGVTSASAAAQSMNIGLTMRSLAKNVTFSTGHFKDNQENQLDITPLLNKGTLAIYMGVKRLPKIINQIQQFSDINFPIAIIFRASLFDEKVIIGTLSDIQQKIKSHQLEGMPGVCIIGDIVNYVDSKIDSKPDQPFYIVQGEKGRAMEKCEILSDEGYGCIIEVKNNDKYHISQQQLYEKIKNQYHHQFIKV
ncbi:uroporphyrinogen-III C-methyltransferase [Staphylococcus warneri]|nr:uroporphyrinogen-III C-methyltransferase [Staphylococcus warneri]